MLHLDIPGQGTLNLAHLVLDLNGTIALDGEVLPGVAGRLATLAESLTIHLVTADTHGKAAATASHLGVQLARIEPGGRTGGGSGQRSQRRGDAASSGLGDRRPGRGGAGSGGAARGRCGDGEHRRRPGPVALSPTAGGYSEKVGAQHTAPYMR